MNRWNVMYNIFLLKISETKLRNYPPTICRIKFIIHFHPST